MKKKVSVCMRGGISTYENLFDSKLINKNYIDYFKCYESIYEHIIRPNENDYTFDFFCHCWNTDLEKEIINLYKPLNHKFENNEIYREEIDKLSKVNPGSHNYSGISQALTIKKSIELKEEYEIKNNIKYDLVILYRYDVLLWKNMDLNKYANLNEVIYVNAHPNEGGDFHFVMNNEKSKDFKYLFDSLYKGHRHSVHEWIKNYIVLFMKLKCVSDSIVPGKHQEVYRKMSREMHDMAFKS